MDEKEQAARIGIIQGVFLGRDKHYHDSTHQLWALIKDNILARIDEFLTEIGVKGPNVYLHWNDLHMINDELIAIAGILIAKGEEPDIENAFFIHVPTDLLVVEDPKVITQFLYRTSNTEALKQMATSINKTEEQPKQHFNADELTDDQKNNLKLYIASKNNTEGSKH